jgi:putative flippase GtrA
VSKVFNLVKFAIVGILATAVHAALYSVAIEVFQIGSQYSNLIGYLCALFVSCVLQKKWTFVDRDVEKSISPYLKFFGASLFGYVLNSLWVFLVVNILKLNALFALAGIIFITPLVSFFLLDRWVFPDKTPGSSG